MTLKELNASGIIGTFQRIRLVDIDTGSYIKYDHPMRYWDIPEKYLNKDIYLIESGSHLDPALGTYNHHLVIHISVKKMEDYNNVKKEKE